MNHSFATPVASSTPLAVELHLPLLRRVAKQMRRKLSTVVEVDDLVGAGALGLLDAIRRFDGQKSCFERYAEIRIRGAIVDYLRSQDWAPRGLRRRARHVEKTQTELDMRFGRPAGVDEIAVRLGIEERHVRDAQSILRLVHLDEDDVGDAAIDPRRPTEPVERRELEQRVQEALSEMTPRSRQVLSMSFVERLTLRAIGERMQLTESRACQLRHRALNEFRIALVGTSSSTPAARRAGAHRNVARGKTTALGAA